MPNKIRITLTPSARGGNEGGRGWDYRITSPNGKVDTGWVIAPTLDDAKQMAKPLLLDGEEVEFVD